MLKAAIIDHHDSFTWNIKAWLKPSFDVSIFDYTLITNINPKHFDLIVLSPGPKTPHDYPQTLEFVKNLKETYPLLGICLGMQIMTIVENGRTSTYYPPLHGKTSSLVSSLTNFDATAVARYHSLKCEVPEVFDVLATSDNLPMIIKHKHKNWLGFQFHPESFLTEKSQLFLTTVVNICSR